MNSTYLKDYISNNYILALNIDNTLNSLTAFCWYFSKSLINISLNVSCDKGVGCCFFRTSFFFLKQSKCLHLVNVPPNYVDQYLGSSILTSPL